MKPAVKKLLFGSGIVLALGIGAYLLNRLHGTVCIFKTLTGIPCPGCGMTRALVAAARGRFELAFYFHPLFPLTPVLVAGVGVYSLSNRPILKKISIVTLLTISAIFVLVWIFRLADGWR